MKKYLMLFTVFAMAAASGFAKASRPNIVWLVSEDNSADWLKLYSPNGASMPNVEKLAEHGLVFNHAFSCGPVCSVARSTIISGCYGPRTGAHYHRQQKRVAMPEGIRMFPYYLRQAGYYTTNCYKEDYNYNNDEKQGVWDASSRNASYRNRKPGQPFFHVQNYGITHEGQLHFGNTNKKTQTNPDTVALYPYHPDTKLFRYTYARYLDDHIELDKQLGEFIRGLEQDGLMDDTFIFYYGDHGGALPRGKGFIYNNGLHPPMVVYVPKNWRHLVPAAPGNRIDGFVEFVDLSATVLNLAGVTPPAGIDGEAFLGQGVSLEELNQRDTAFGYADRFDEKYDVVRTFRKGRFHYMRSYQPFNFDGLHNFYRYGMKAYREWRDLFKEGKLSATESQFFKRRPAELLFDVEADPNEIHNLAGDPAYADQLVEMRRLLREQVKSLPDLSFYPEPIMLSKSGGNGAAFGAAKKAEIAKLVDIADLSLKPFPEAKAQIAQALDSENSWERYWGLITCSSFDKQAAPFYVKAKKMAQSDAEPLVRVRAAEFLGLTGAADPRPAIMDVLRKTDDTIEANLILNSVALLSSFEYGYDFDVSEFKKKPWARGKSMAKHRIGYLMSRKK